MLFSLIFTYLFLYFDLSFSVFFSSVLMYPDLQTDVYNLDSVENNLLHSAKGSLDGHPFPHRTRSPTTRSPTSSATPRILSPTLHRHRTWTWATLRSASCSPKHTESTPITAIQKACQSVSRHCLSCSIEQGNVREKICRSINWFRCHEKHVQCLQQVFWKHPSWENGRQNREFCGSETAQMHRLGPCLKNRDRWLSQNNC